MWISQDKIQKESLEEGIWGRKPYEESTCKLEILEGPTSMSHHSSIVIGDSDDLHRRLLDQCVLTMNEKEVAKFGIPDEGLMFTIKLLEVKHSGYIYEWDAKRKFDLAQRHKARGVELFQKGHHKDAAYRFSKGLKILQSIPINAEELPVEIDTIPLVDINSLKANLYNNLASYYLKKEAWIRTINSCKRVFEYDDKNIKAHYKLGIAYINDRDFERAKISLNVVLAAEPNNNAANEHLKFVNSELHKAEVKFNGMVKKMFA